MAGERPLNNNNLVKCHVTLPMKEETIKTAARIALGGALIFAGMSHLTFLRKEFQAQVPDWVPLKKDDTVVYSGIAEIALGAAIALAPKHQKQAIGATAAAFFIAVFPGNLAQYTDQRSAFGLDSDNKRLVRLFFQPVLVGWAWWSTRR